MGEGVEIRLRGEFLICPEKGNMLHICGLFKKQYYVKYDPFNIVLNIGNKCCPSLVNTLTCDAHDSPHAIVEENLPAQRGPNYISLMLVFSVSE